MGARSKFDRTKWELERERCRLPDPAPPPAEPDLSLRGAITGFFKNLDGQTGSSLHKIFAKWKIIAGENVAAHSRPGRLNENILYVYVDSSTWLAEITRFHSDNILRKIQNEIGSAKGLRFQVNPRECRMDL
jgi:hypothetical protein